MTSTGPYTVAEFLHYGLYVLLGFVCIGAIVRALWSPLEILREPCCGGCGHGVRDILQGICPECGGQYAKVGITTPRMAIRLRGSLPVALLAWTTLVTLLASITYGWMQQRAWASYTASAVTLGSARSTKQQESYTTDLTPVYLGSFGSPFAQSSTKDRPDYRLSLALSYVIDGDKVESGTCVLKLRKNGEMETFPLTIDLSDGSYTIKDDKGKEIAKGGKDAKLDDAALEAWFKQAGIDTELKSVKRSMKDAAKVTRYVRSDPGAIQTTLNQGFSTGDNGALQSNGGSSSSSGVPGSFAMGASFGPPSIGSAATAVSIAGLGTLYLAGVVGIVWRNRRMARG